MSKLTMDNWQLTIAVFICAQRAGFAGYAPKRLKRAQPSEMIEIACADLFYAELHKMRGGDFFSARSFFVGCDKAAESALTG